MSLRQAEKDARALREEVARRDPRAVQLPIDPIRVADALGIDVFTARMASGVSGTLEKQRGSDPVIYLSRVDSQNRQRFTCAHELGHYVRRTSSGDMDYSFVDERAQLASAGSDEEEIYANQFAAALLMPEELVRQEHRRGLGRVSLALRFGVSEEAMGYRLQNLGLT
jgi:Zn-dependent peptidase ImmA (M78 family)